MALRRWILLAALLAAPACSDDDGDGGQGPGGEPPDGDVEVRNNFFDPDELEVQPGATVVWAWQGGVTHNVTFDDGQASEDQSSGTYERTFAAPGSFPYHCTIHGTATTGMRGVVTVAEAATGNEGGGGAGSGDPGDMPGGY